MNEQEQQIDPIAVKAMEVALGKMGANLAVSTQNATFWEMKAEELRQSQESLMKLLAENGVDLEAMLAGRVPEAAQANEVAQEGEVTAFPVSAPVEDGDDGSAPS